jgi:hypothetical protein
MPSFASAQKADATIAGATCRRMHRIQLDSADRQPPEAALAAACVKFSKIDQGVGYCSSAKIHILLFDRQNHPSVPT